MWSGLTFIYPVSALRTAVNDPALMSLACCTHAGLLIKTAYFLYMYHAAVEYIYARYVITQWPITY